MEINVAGASRCAVKGETANRRMLAIGGAMRRKRLSDITNVSSAVKVPAPECAGNQQNALQIVPSSMNTKEYIAQLLRENTALLRLVGERNKMIELSSGELQNLKTALQKVQQQNWHLAQTNSRMLAELNLGKDRLKAMKHELGCAHALVKAKNIEMEEKKKLDKRQTKKLDAESKEEEGIKRVDDDAAAADHPVGSKKVCNTNRKRALRTQSLGSSSAMHEGTSEEKDENRRRSLRRRSSSLKSETFESAEDLFEIEDTKFPIYSSTETLYGEGSIQVLASAHKKSDVIAGVKTKGESEIGFPQDQNPLSQRSSIGRPVRKAAEKVSSYKEIPLNIKMRRSS